jgi:uncharacterized lipoprotein|nr:MAG TPA: hypothetical protein [Caudoviricetes sp.]
MKAYNISYKHNGVYQAIIVKAESKEHAEQFFRAHKPDATVYGVQEQQSISEDIRKGKPIITAK